MLAAIDTGMRSIETGLGVPLEEPRQRLGDYKVILLPLAFDDLEQIVAASLRINPPPLNEWAELFSFRRKR